MASCAALGALPRSTHALTQAITAIDSHAHVFRRGLPLADARRYAPDYDATPEDYLRMLDANGVSNGVLVQPSFLGTDNSYLIDALIRYPDRLRGIAVVQPDVSPAELQRLSAAGIVGIRLNLIGAPDPQFQTAPWPSLLRRLADLDWQVEIQAEARRWPDLLGPLLDSGVKVVADHFGKPDPATGVGDPGFRHLLAMGKTGRIWVKISGSYRNGAGLPAAAIPLLRDRIGLHHLVWGSDWPHTQFETVTDYARARAELEVWLPDPTDRRIVLLEAPCRLFHLGR
ncbi:amidohydrolase family protein [Methylobacterium planeticum]|uniref:amidohydrolase family protein n=1 Tax=Methylobacterium planeticum TaxID=2615211 RepID=UPI001FEDDD98|nr:amidohydrolase family protein [Methylobacterium planeticum]